jgi:hypothetical protein
VNPFIWVGIGLAVILAGAAVAISLTSSHPHDASANGTHKTVHRPRPTSQVVLQTTTTTSTTQPLAQGQAVALSGLLTQSANDRSAIDSAVSDIANCGDLEGDESTLEAAASSRQSLLNQLQDLNITSLPNSAQLTQYLTAAWTNSMGSDQSYSEWAQDESNDFDGCTVDDYSDLNYMNAQTTDAQSTSAKSSFANLWNSIAATYNLPSVTTASF